MDKRNSAYVSMIYLMKQPALIFDRDRGTIEVVNPIMGRLAGDIAGRNVFDVIEFLPVPDLREFRRASVMVQKVMFRPPGEEMRALLTTMDDMMLLVLLSEDHFHSVPEEEYRQIMEFSPQAMFIANRKGHVEYANRALLKLLGSPSLEKTKSINIWESPNMRVAGISDDIRRVFDTKEHIAAERWYQSHWGKRVKIRYYLYPIVYGDEAHKIVGIVTPLEEAKGETLNDGFLLSQKLETLGLLAGGIAHDFNNILTSLLGYLEETRNYVEPGTPAHENVQQMMRIVKSASDLVYQLLAFSRRQVLKIEKIEINEHLRRLKPMLQRIVGERIRLQLRLHEEPLWIAADAMQIQQVIVNMVVNARDAIEGDGTITIATDKYEITSLETAEGAVASVGDPGDTFVVISIEDTGQGIPEEVLPHIFEPFFTTKKDKGTGLGLATSHGIIRQHGGVIMVSSQVGRGSRFDIYLPMVRGDEGAVDEEDEWEEERTPPPMMEVVVMFVEDEELIRKVTTRYLSKQGYKVITAADGQEALEKARGLARLDVVITDVVMPRMNGIELVRELKRIHPGVRVIYTSGYSDEMIRQYKAKDAVFLQKPYTPQQLEKEIYNILQAAYY